MEWWVIVLICVGGVLAFVMLCWFWHLLTCRRPDGKEIKNVDPMFQMIPLFMPTREESTNKTMLTVYMKDWECVKEYNYREIITASLVRLLTIWPKFNSFTIGGRFYQRNWIDMSMMVHKSLRTGADESCIKPRFTGRETLAEVKVLLDAEINKAVLKYNGVDKATDKGAKFPLWIMKLGVGFIKMFDRFGWLPEKFMRYGTPFHTSFFLTDMRSIGLDTCYHHLYNFGNCGIFVAMGKDRVIPVVGADGTVTNERIMELGITLDERCFDGLYGSRAMRTWKKMLQNPACLLEPLDETEIHH